MATNTHAKRSAKKARPSKKRSALKYRPSERVYRAKPIHPSEKTERANIRSEATANVSNLAFEYWVIFRESSDKPEGQMTPMEKMVMVDRGVTKKDLESLKDKTELDYDELAKVLSVG